MTLRNAKNIYRRYVPEEIRSQVYTMRRLLKLQGKDKETWIDILEAQQKRELGRLLAECHDAGMDGKKNILIYSMIPWIQGGVEHLLSIALRLRGHNVKSAICGGMLPDCEMHYYDFDRPGCEKCIKRAQRYIKTFGINPLLSVNFLSENDLEETHSLVANLSENNLKKMEYGGLPVGEISRFQMNIFYQNFLVELDESQVEQLRKFCEVAILLAKYSKRMLKEIKPNLAIVSNGKAFTYRPFYLLARQMGIRVVTWEEHAFDNTMKFVFNNNNYAGEIHLENVWPEEKTRRLNLDQLNQLSEYFDQWRRAKITPFAYHQKTEHDTSFFYSSLSVQGNSPIIACFPNMVRDTSAFDRDIAFESLLDWILQIVNFAYSREDLVFIIKAHPGERCLPEKYAKYNRFFICEEVRKHFSAIPKNVHLIEGDSPINTYTIIQEADVVNVYTSTIGLECALEGRLACVVGDVHYRGKGFTQDIFRPEELWEFLSSDHPYPRHISSQQRNMARRYAFLWRFRHPFIMPFYNPDDQSFYLENFKVLLPGNNQIIERLCQCIVEGEPFIDINPH
jgi:hypothetical protein